MTVRALPTSKGDVMAHSGGNKTKRAPGDRTAQAWFTKALAKRRKKNKAAKRARKRNR